MSISRNNLPAEVNAFLANLPDINFAEKDTAKIEAEVIARFEQFLGRRLFPGDPWRQILLVFVYYMSLQRSNIDFAGKQNLLKYSGEGYLENLAALLGVERLAPVAAVTTLEFTLSTALPSATTIPAGTRATPGNDIYFATSEDVEIPAGELSVEAHAVCTKVGAIGNGFLPGQVDRLVDPFAFSCSVRNIDLTQGGADRESLDALRERTRLAPESFSTAGPYGAYIYWAKTASQLIIDVAVESPSPGVVDIIPLLEGGEIPTQTTLDDVYKVCSADNRRPLTDKVEVRAPQAVDYGIDITYYIARRHAPVGLTIQQRAKQAVHDFILWQKSKLGRDINPSRLVEMVKNTGVKRVDIEALCPAFTPLAYFQLGVADMDKVKITYGGLEDD